MHCPAKPESETVVILAVEVKFAVEGRGVFQEARGLLIVAAEARGRHIGVRNEPQNFQRQRAKAARRDNIIRKCGPACGRYGNWISTGVQSQGRVRGIRSLVGIIDSAAYVARCASSWGNGLEVSTTEIIPGHCQVVKLPSGIVNAQNVAEEEKLVSQDGPAHVTAVVIVGGRGFWRDA